MLCAHTVRRLKPGTFDQFRTAFMPSAEEAPAGWVRFHMLRGLADPDEVVTFGFFDGTLEELEQSQVDENFEDRRDSVGEYVEAVIANGVYEIAESIELDAAG
jgi:hypothetical protein